MNCNYTKLAIFTTFVILCETSCNFAKADILQQKIYNFKFKSPDSVKCIIL